MHSHFVLDAILISEPCCRSSSVTPAPIFAHYSHLTIRRINVETLSAPLVMGYVRLTQS
jgi:hypothetical protein